MCRRTCPSNSALSKFSELRIIGEGAAFLMWHIGYANIWNIRAVILRVGLGILRRHGKAKVAWERLELSTSGL